MISVQHFDVSVSILKFLCPHHWRKIPDSQKVYERLGVWEELQLLDPSIPVLESCARDDLPRLFKFVCQNRSKPLAWEAVDRLLLGRRYEMLEVALTYGIAIEVRPEALGLLLESNGSDMFRWLYSRGVITPEFLKTAISKNMFNGAMIRHLPDLFLLHRPNNDTIEIYLGDIIDSGCTELFDLACDKISDARVFQRLCFHDFAKYGWALEHLLETRGHVPMLNYNNRILYQTGHLANIAWVDARMDTAANCEFMPPISKWPLSWQLSYLTRVWERCTVRKLFKMSSPLIILQRKTGADRLIHWADSHQIKIDWTECAKRNAADCRDPKLFVEHILPVVDGWLKSARRSELVWMCIRVVKWTNVTIMDWFVRDVWPSCLKLCADENFAKTLAFTLVKNAARLEFCWQYPQLRDWMRSQKCLLSRYCAPSNEFFQESFEWLAAHKLACCCDKFVAQIISTLPLGTLLLAESICGVPIVLTEKDLLAAAMTNDRDVLRVLRRRGYRWPQLTQEQAAKLSKSVLKIVQD